MVRPPAREPGLLPKCATLHARSHSPGSQGAFYVFPRIEGLTIPSLLQTASTRNQGRPGARLGLRGRRRRKPVRICYASDRSILEEAMVRLHRPAIDSCVRHTFRFERMSTWYPAFFSPSSFSLRPPPPRPTGPTTAPAPSTSSAMPEIKAARERLTEMEQLRHQLGVVLGKDNLDSGLAHQPGDLPQSARIRSARAAASRWSTGVPRRWPPGWATPPLPRDFLRALTLQLIENNAGRMPEATETALCDLFSTIQVNGTRVACRSASRRGRASSGTAGGLGQAADARDSARCIRRSCASI